MYAGVGYTVCLFVCFCLCVCFFVFRDLSWFLLVDGAMA